MKTDILSGECTYSTDRKKLVNVENISARRAREIIELNRQGEKPLSLLDNGSVKPEEKSSDLLADGDISRFDKFAKKKKRKKKAKPGQPQAAEGQRKPRPQGKPRGDKQPREGGRKGDGKPQSGTNQPSERPRKPREGAPEGGEPVVRKHTEEPKPAVEQKESKGENEGK